MTVNIPLTLAIPSCLDFFFFGGYVQSACWAERVLYILRSMASVSVTLCTGSALDVLPLVFHSFRVFFFSVAKVEMFPLLFPA